MKAVILAGGFGTRLSEETNDKPKPMVEIGGKPILWHIMNIYAAQGVDEFIITLGYKAEMVKAYFLHYYAINNDISIDLSTGETTIHGNKQPHWKVHLIDTGIDTQTGGRLKRVREWVDKDEAFMFTYGDGVADIDVKALLDFHKSHGNLATVTTVKSPARFGRIRIEENRIDNFYEKPEEAEGWVNGGFFVLSPEVFDYIEGDHSVWEREPVEKLVADNSLMGYRHYGFWSCMDTLKEKLILEELWRSGEAPWKIW